MDSFYPIDVLMIREHGQIVFIESLGKGHEFEISYLHSLSKTWVKDVYVYDNHNLFHRSTVFEDEGGAGMPLASRPEEEFIYGSNGLFEIKKNTLLQLPMHFYVRDMDTWVLSLGQAIYQPHDKEIKLDVKSLSMGHYIVLMIRCKYEI